MGARRILKLLLGCQSASTILPPNITTIMLPANAVPLAIIPTLSCLLNAYAEYLNASSISFHTAATEAIIIQFV